MRMKLLIALIIFTILFGSVLILAGLNPLIALIGGGITWFMVYFLWSPPQKHKEFSDRDRLEATSRAMGGSGAPPELPTPNMPEKKHHKHKDKDK
jgi:hypothetical protein